MKEKRNAWKACNRHKRFPSSNLGHSAPFTGAVLGFVVICHKLSGNRLFDSMFVAFERYKSCRHA